jgi:hypothetical protein
MRIELKKFKWMPSLSEETNCYSANVYVNGKLAFTASNRGHGGCDDYYPIASKDGTYDASRKLLAEATAYAKSLPPIDTDWGQINSDLETLIGNLVNRAINAGDLRKRMRKNILYVTPESKDGNFFILPKSNVPIQLMSLRAKGATIAQDDFDSFLNTVMA